MTMMVSRKASVVLFLAILLFVTTHQTAGVSDALSASLPGGPFVDSVLFKVTEGYDEQILALINDEIDLIGETIASDYLPALSSAENIEVANVPRNGYGYLCIKTDKYPLNITDFRRAFAFALDKERICDDVWDGLAVPQDSMLPQVNPFSIEGQLPYNYYEDNVALGSQLLDAARFLDDDSDGFREAPNGSDFSVTIECASSSNVALEVGGIAAEALQALNIDAVSVSAEFSDYILRLYEHGDYDMVYLGASFSTFDINWIAYEFWGEYGDEYGQNFPCWRNATYDSWRAQLLYSSTYEDVYEAASKMQEIWIHACPEIVCYENLLFTAHRTDRFEGYSNDIDVVVPGWWTNYKVHLKESEGGPFGGQFRWSTSLDLDTFNFMVTCACVGIEVSDFLYDSLIRTDADYLDIPWLAESYMIEMHDDNPGVTEGHTRFTFNVVDNATWTDGIPLTAEDVAFTLNYYKDAPGNPYGYDLSNMTAALVSGPDTVVVEFDTESYWHLHTVGYKPIIPKHVFEEIGPEGWNTWNPSIDDLVTSGPFVVSEYVAGNHTELTANPDYFRGAERPRPTLGNPSDITYTVASTGNVIAWTASSPNPLNYTVYRNGTVHDAGLWAGGQITVDIDGLNVGVYNLTLCVFDLFLESASDTVWVTVSEMSTGTSTSSTLWPFGALSPLSIGITVGSLVVILMAAVLIVGTKPGNRP